MFVFVPCRHPLFPVLALLFEKCELATQSVECPSSDGFNSDLQVFIQQQQRDKKPFLSDNPEANELVRLVNSQPSNLRYAKHFGLSDDQVNTSPAHPPPGAGEGSGAVQGLLQSLHHVPQRQDAEREPPEERLRRLRQRRQLRWRDELEVVLLLGGRRRSCPLHAATTGSQCKYFISTKFFVRDRFTMVLKRCAFFVLNITTSNL